MNQNLYPLYPNPKPYKNPETVEISGKYWRRAWDSNPRGCYTLLAFQASSLATRSILRVKSVSVFSSRRFPPALIYYSKKAPLLQAESFPGAVTEVRPTPPADCPVSDKSPGSFLQNSRIRSILNPKLGERKLRARAMSRIPSLPDPDNTGVGKRHTNDLK